MEELLQIPDWLGEAIVSALGWAFMVTLTALGWVLKTVFDLWKHSRLPFKQDKEQFEDLITKETAVIVSFFRENNNPFIEWDAIDGLDALLDRLRDMRWPPHQNKKLRSKRTVFTDSIAEMSEFMGTSTQPKSSGGGVILPEDDKRKKKYFCIRDIIIKSFEDYRDYGTKLFSVKLSKELSNG